MNTIKCQHCGDEVDRLYDEKYCSHCYIALSCPSVSVLWAKDSEPKLIKKTFKHYRYLDKGEIPIGSDEAKYGSTDDDWKVLGDNCCSVGIPAYAPGMYRRGYN